MGRFSYVVFYLGFALQVVLLGRLVKIKIWKHYPFFFAYFGPTVIHSVSAVLILLLKPEWYRAWYWTDYLTSAPLRFAVAWEIFRQVFPFNSPARRVAGCMLVIVLCTLAVCFYVRPPVDLPLPDVIRKMGLADAAWILVVLAMAKYYSRPLGRNIRGMAFGFLAYVSTQVGLYSARELFSALRPMWSLLTSLAFTYMIVVWLFSLWVYTPNEVTEVTVVADERTRRAALAHWGQQVNAIGLAIRKATRL
jgi:hypothetical protein